MITSKFKHTLVLGVTLSMIVPRPAQCKATWKQWFVGGAVATATCAILYELYKSYCDTAEQKLCRVKAINNELTAFKEQLSGNLSEDYLGQLAARSDIGDLADNLASTLSRARSMIHILKAVLNDSKIAPIHDKYTGGLYAQTKEVYNQLAANVRFLEKKLPVLRAYAALRNNEISMTNFWRDLLRGRLDDNSVRIFARDKWRDSRFKYRAVIERIDTDCANIDVVLRYQCGASWQMHARLLAIRERLRLIKDKILRSRYYDEEHDARLIRDAQQESLRLERERIEMERKKAEAAHIAAQERARENDLQAERLRQQRERDADERHRREQEDQARLYPRPAAFNPAAVQVPQGGWPGGREPSAPPFSAEATQGRPSDDPPPPYTP